MTGSQYKNIIQWTLFFYQNHFDELSASITKAIFNNLGVAYPNGNNKEVIRILKQETYLGWRSCNYEDVQKYANRGIAAMAINDTNIIVIIPDATIHHLSANETLDKIKNPFVKHITELSEEEREQYHFFVYNYGHKIE